MSKLNTFSKTHISTLTEDVITKIDLVHRLNELSYKLTNNINKPPHAIWHFDNFPNALKAVTLIQES